MSPSRPSLPTPPTRRLALWAVAVGAATGLAACGAGSTAPGSAAPAGSGSPVLNLTDGWVKAVDAVATPSSSPSTDALTHTGAMTALFGTLSNPGGSAVHVTGASSPVAGMAQLHETVKTASGTMQMQEKPDGFTIPPGGALVLQPGGDHVMLMGLTQALPTGTTVSVTLITDGGPATFQVPVRAFPGAQESYAPSPAHS